MTAWWDVSILVALDAGLWLIVYLGSRPSAADRRLLAHASPRLLRERARPSLWERIGVPMLRGMAAALRPFASATRRTRAADRLARAGLDWDPALLDGLKITGAVAGIAAALVEASRVALPGGPLGWMALGGGFGYLGPEIWLRHRGDAREREFRKALPDALDVLAICLRAGLGFQAAVAEYARNAVGVAGDAFRRYLDDLAFGRPPEDGLVEMARRHPTDDLAVVTAALIQGVRLGSPVAEILEEQAAHFRALALRRAEEAVQALSTRLVLPLVVFVFPQVFIIGLGPVALRLMGPGGLFR